MSGVEAAASLFGGTDSEDRDLFASLGADSESPETNANNANDANDLFGSSAQYPAFLQDESNIFDSTTTTYPETAQPASHPPANTYQTPPPTTTHYEPSYQYTPTSSVTTDNNWNQQNTQSNTSAYNSYTPTSYSTPASHYPSYTPTSYAPTQSYAPPPTVPASTPQPPLRSPYDPPPSTYTPTTARYDASPYSYASNTASTPSNYGVAKVPAVTPAVAPPAALNRPKVSNAYDPPFLPTLSSKKSTRSIVPPPAHNIYAQQTPAYGPPPSAPVAPPPSTHYTQANSHVQNGATPYNPIAPEKPTQNYAARYSPVQPPSHSNYTPYETKTATSPPPSVKGQNGSTNHDVFADIHSQYNTAPPIVDEFPSNESYQDSTSPKFSQERPPSVPARDATSPPAQLSPSLVPLPYSPPTIESELHNYPSPPSRAATIVQSYAAPIQPSLSSSPKKEPPTKDPYVPKLPYNTNNYIPRTSSPLSLYGGAAQHEQKPAPPPSNLTGAKVSPYDPPPRTTLGSTSAYAPPTHTKTDTGRPARLDSTRLNLPPTASTYAPSPSLLGTNDPLQRTSARAPIITFGFGGKMVTCFHSMAGMNAGFDVALSSRTSSEIRVYTLHKLLPETALHTSNAFPGPLLSDPGTTSLSIVRANQATQAKAKKAALVTYLNGRAMEIDQGLGYLSPIERQRAEGKRTLINLLKVMIENDGKLLGTTQSDSAVRLALVPRLENVAALQDGMSLQATLRPTSEERPISTTVLRASALDKIEEFLLQGERRQAYHYAADEKLWAHAMIIASSIDKDSWKEVVSEFLRSEFASSGGAHNAGSTEQNGRESLKVAYSLFSGQGAAAVQELSSPSLLQKATLRPPMALAAAVTPRTPNFANLGQSGPASQVSVQSLQNWAETAAMLISSPLSPEASAALTALGDQLMGHNFVEAAHSCYLLSPQTSLVGGLGSPNVRITLLGTKYPTDVMRDPDTLILSEIWEFAMSLVPTAKGQEPFHGLPHFQAYRLLRAAWLAEIGELQLAGRYCEAIAASVSQNSPYTTFSLMHHLQGLQQRLTGVCHDKSASWIGGKIAKPSLDSIGGWLEGRFTKLVTGDVDATIAEDDTIKPAEQPFAGPFAHYSTISSTVPSARSSPQPRPPQTTLPQHPPPQHPPPQRTSSAMATPSYYAPPAPVERSSSALGYMGQKSSPTPPFAPFSQSATNGHGNGYSNGHGNGNGMPAPIDTSGLKSDSYGSGEAETPVQHGDWWESAGLGDSSQTPTAATFVKLEQPSLPESTDGFISLMDDQQLSFGAPSPISSHSRYASQQDSIEDDEDLGFGNSKSRVDNETNESGSSSQSSAKSSPAPASPVDKPASAQQSGNGSGGGWLSRWWKGGPEQTTGPVKASLGEESAFYYDKEQKRWVNKKAGGDETPKATPPPPPPSRPQTASPGFSGPKAPATPGPPPPRSSSAIDLSTEPPTKVPMRIRSNLAPPTESAPSTPTGTRYAGDAPPPIRPRSQASAKRSVRSRYVDVFQQEGNGSS